MIRKQLNLLLIICLIYACGSGSASMLQPTSPFLDRTLNNFLQLHGESEYFSAISVTVQCNNRQPVYGVAGTTELNGGLPINTNSLFQIGSITKSFTSVVILQLAADPSNNLSLQDTMSKWFPEYPRWANVTIKQLLNMSSGIPNYSMAIKLKSLESPTYYFSPEEIVSSSESASVIFAPGNGYYYSNTDYLLLGMLIQKITGNSPITEIQNRIINNLGLTHTYFPSNLPEAVVPIFEMTNGYAYVSGIQDPYKFLNGLQNTTWSSMSIYSTAGGIISTPEDINTYIHALFNPGSILTQSEFTSLTTNMVDMESSVGFPNAGQPITRVSVDVPIGYGLGVMNMYHPAPIGNYYSYSGNTNGYSFTYYDFPTLNMYILFTLNNSANFLLPGDLASTSSDELFNLLYKYAYTNECGKSLQVHK